MVDCHRALGCKNFCRFAGAGGPENLPHTSRNSSVATIAVGQDTDTHSRRVVCGVWDFLVGVEV